MHPLALHLAPQLQDWEVVRVQVEERAAIGGHAALPGDCREPLEAAQLAGFGSVGLRLGFGSIVVASKVQFFSGQQGGQPLQFPERPFALLAVR